MNPVSTVPKTNSFLCLLTNTFTLFMRCVTINQSNQRFNPIQNSIGLYRSIDKSNKQSIREAISQLINQMC